MARYKVLMTDCIFIEQELERRALEAVDAELVLAPAKDEETLARMAADVDAILVTYAEITANIIAGAPKCKIIARTGIGYNNIDLAAARERGIAVTNVPDYCIGEVADHTLALMLTCLRKTAYLAQLVRQGVWEMNTARPIARLSTLTVGLMGMGNIGKAVVRRVQAMDMKAIVYDPFLTEDTARLLGVERVETLEQLASCSDVLTIHAPLTETTRGAVNAEVFARMKPSAIVINTSRGPIINEQHLYEALRDGKLAGCGLDVLEREDESERSPLLAMEQAIITPHVAFYSSGSDMELRQKAVQQVVQVLRGEEPKYRVNS